MMQDGHHADPRVIDFVERKLVTFMAGMAAQRRFAPWSDWRGDAGYTGSGFKAWRGKRARTRDKCDVRDFNIWLQRLVVGPPDWETCLPHQRDAFRPFPLDSEWLYPRHRVLSNKALKPYHLKFGRRAEALVDRLWPQIETVAATLIEKKVLSQAQVRRLVKAPRR